MTDRMTRSQLIACLDAVASECTTKAAEYQHLLETVENLRAQVALQRDESVPRYLDTHEMVSSRFGGKRTA